MYLKWKKHNKFTIIVRVSHLNPFQSNKLPKVTAGCHFRSKVIGRMILHIPCSIGILLLVMLRKHSKCTYTIQKLIQKTIKDSSKSYAVSQTACWETAYDWSQMYLHCLGDSTRHAEVYTGSCLPYIPSEFALRSVCVWFTSLSRSTS